MRIKLFDKHYDLNEYFNKTTGKISDGYLYHGENFCIEISKGRWAFFVFPSKRDFGYAYAEDLQELPLDNTDMTNVINIQKLVQYSIEYNLDLVDKKYWIML